MAHVLIVYAPGGGVQLKPHNYAGDKCYEAARPYEAARTGEHTIVAGEGEVAVPVTAAQHQKAGQ